MTGVQTCALRSEEHTSELQSHDNLVCRLLLEKNKVRDTEPRNEPARARTTPPNEHHEAERTAEITRQRQHLNGGNRGRRSRNIFFFYGQGAPRDSHSSPPDAFPD